MAHSGFPSSSVFVVVPLDVSCFASRGVNSRELERIVAAFVRSTYRRLVPGTLLSLDGASELIRASVRSIRVCDCCVAPNRGTSSATNEILTDDADLKVYLYRLNKDEAYDEPLEYSGTGDTDAELPSCSVVALPHASLEGIWESLFYGDTEETSSALKCDLLQYASTALLFSSLGVDPHLLTWNRMMLFHGPPGTGKTSLCKAFAQKLSIRLRSTFPSSQLVEVNAHSLFSRWFSESGKQVMILFQRIRELVEDERCLVCLLIDEVESLAAARQSAMKGNEPSDAIRVVNALLTQLDSLQRHKNVLVLTTSNITAAIDVAFIDRADKKVFIGPPGVAARSQMLSGSLAELIIKGLVALPSSIPLLRQSCGRNGVADTTLHRPFGLSQEASTSTSALVSAAETGAEGTEYSSPSSTRMEKDAEQLKENLRESRNHDKIPGLWDHASLAAALKIHPALTVCATASETFTGRIMRKLPFLAFCKASQGVRGFGCSLGAVSRCKDPNNNNNNNDSSNDGSIRANNCNENEAKCMPSTLSSSSSLISPMVYDHCMSFEAYTSALLHVIHQEKEASAALER